MNFRLTVFGKKVIFVTILFFILLISIIIIIKLNNESSIKIKELDPKKQIINYIDDNFLTDNSESDEIYINKIFANGISISEIKDLYVDNFNYIENNEEYTPVSYNFEKKLHYYDLEELYNSFNKSDIVKLIDLGKSADGRTIYGIEIGRGNKVLYMDANIHAAEIANTLILTRFLSELVNLYESGNESVITRLNEVKIAFIPSINPDGYEVYNFGVESLNNKNLWWYQNKDKYDFELMKSNANGIDINRNFPTQNAGLYYKENKLIKSVALEKTTKSSIYFGGYNLGSEPETRASMKFMLKHYKNTYAYINFHSQGRVIYAGKPNLSNEFNTLCSNFAKKISKINKYKVHGLSAEEVGEGNDGSATDFMSELANGFKFSTKTLRLSTDKYKNNNSQLLYEYPVITLETIKTYTRDVSIFKDEYNNNGLRKILFELIK